MMSLLEKQFGDVRRAADAAEALCLIEQPEFAERLGLVISGHQATGIGGPAFVAELRARVPEVPVLVLGSPDEARADYTEAQIAFLPRPGVGKEMLAVARRMLEQRRNAAA